MRILRGASVLLATTAAISLGGWAGATELKTYTYDTLGRLTGQTAQGTVNNADARTYCYDPAGNRTLVAATETGALASCPGATPTPVATLAIADATVVEGGTLSFAVTRSGNTAIAATASYATTNGTATAPSDYTTATGTVSFAPGETSKTIAVATVNDAVVESSETLTVTLSGPGANTTLADASATGTITDNDTLPAIAITNASVTEGGTLGFAVTRSGNTAAASSVNYATSNGTAVAPGDYTAGSGAVSFAIGETSKTISVLTINDTAVEATETLTVTLSGPSGATITSGTATGTINDNDVAPPATLTIADASTTEGGSLSFVVTRAGNTATTGNVSYATSNGTAVAPGDYTANSGTVTFAANETARTISVATVNDTAVESTETLTVTLSSPSSGFTISDSSGTGSIIDNDTAGNAPPVAVDDAVSMLCGDVSTINVVANDTDADGDPLTIVSVSYVSGDLGGYSMSAPQSVTLNAGGTNNTFVLSYVVRDTSNAQDTGLITVRVMGGARICGG